MARKPQEFTNRQQDMLDDATALALDIDAKALHGMELLKNGDTMGAFLDLGDIRNLSLEQRNRIGNARRGKYD